MLIQCENWSDNQYFACIWFSRNQKSNTWHFTVHLSPKLQGPSNLFKLRTIHITIKLRTVNQEIFMKQFIWRVWQAQWKRQNIYLRVHLQRFVNNEIKINMMHKQTISVSLYLGLDLWKKKSLIDWQVLFYFCKTFPFQLINYNINYFFFCLLFGRQF